MEWLQRINKAICYIEDNLTQEICVEDVSKHVFSSNSNFQRMFYLVTGITIGEYIRNRRLSLAGRDLRLTNSKVVDIAMKYQYDTSESFSKAFSRFHGISPADVKRHYVMLKFFRPLTINISIQGGFDMTQKLMDKFYWSNIDEQNDEKLTDSEKYQRIIEWAGKARGQNPGVFDELIKWMLDDSEWSDDKLIENEQILMQGVLVRFKEQNAKLRAYLLELKPSGVVNPAVFKALDRFDDELSGTIHDKWLQELQEVVAKMFADFSIMRDRGVREQIAGGITGSTGTDSVDIYGYIDCLKDRDACVQWTLFMPDLVERQQNGFRVDSFEYKKMPAMRFIGQRDDDAINTAAGKDLRKEISCALDAMSDYQSGFNYDVLLIHHDGLGVDIEPGHSYWGRFMKADTPVPEGFLYFDFVTQNDGKEGTPFISQFAYATFSGDFEALHQCEGYDSKAIYDVTRNIILGQGVNIPYPNKYWTGEVYLNGYDKYSNAFIFSVELS